MIEKQVLELLERHFLSLFPKTCTSCGRQFATLRDYIQTTTRIGPAQSYDAELGDWSPAQPVGSLVLANCPCGSTLALTTEGMALPDRRAILEWVREETLRRGVRPSDVLESLRDTIRRRALASGR